MFDDIKSLKLIDWASYLLYFAGLWVAFPYILLNSMRWGFLLSENTIGWFVETDGTIFRATVLVISLTFVFTCIFAIWYAVSFFVKRVAWGLGISTRRPI